MYAFKMFKIKKNQQKITPGNTHAINEIIYKSLVPI